jgi:hypothetical protein
MTMVAACGSDPDGDLVDGVWVGERADCTADLPAEHNCERLIACAASREWPNKAPEIQSVVVFDRPDRLKDGTLIQYGVGGSVVVFSLADGAQAAQSVTSTDGCPTGA